MRGSAAFRTGVAPGGALAPDWVKNELWRKARTVPSLDLRFADNKSLVDATTGASLVTFTRASSGTFVGSDGVLRTAVTNLLLRSEEFDNASWAKTSSTVSSNVIVAPNGTLTSDKFIEGSGSVTPFLTQAVSVTSGASYTFTVYAKEDLTSAKRYLTLLLPSAQFGSNVRVTFNLANGTSVSTNNPDATSIIFVGDGWYRCSVTEAATSTASAGVQIRLANAVPDTLGSYTGDGTSGIYIWGAQLEQSTTVGEYIPTTSVINSAPRFDHNPTTGESLGLLVEEARTNLVLRSEDFATTWTTTNATVPVSGQTTPAGTTNANSLTGDGLSSTHLVSQSVTFTAAAHTLSVYAKKGTNNFLQVRFGAAAIAAGIGFANFNLDTGVVGTVGAGISGSSITAAGNGWYRCSITGTTLAAASNVGLYLVTSATAASAEVNTLATTVNIWGAQLEAGAFPTSYIPTTTAAATRSADVCSISGSNFSSWYRQDEGTVFAEMDRNTAISSSSTVVSINDNSSNNRLYNFRQDSASALTVISATGGTLDGALGVTLANTSNRNRVAAAQSLNNLAAAANGGTVLSDTSVAMPTVTQVQIGNVTGTSYFNGTIRRICFWPTRLPSNTLQSITQ